MASLATLLWLCAVIRPIYFTFISLFKVGLSVVSMIYSCVNIVSICRFGPGGDWQQGRGDLWRKVIYVT